MKKTTKKITTTKHSCLVTTSAWVASTLNRELKYHKWKPYKVFKTWVYVNLTQKQIAHALVRLRTWTTLWMEVATKKSCNTFEDLYALVLSRDRSQYIQPKQWITISCNVHKSTLNSERTIQSVAHKAIITSLTGSDSGHWDIDKSIQPAHIRINIADDECTVFLDCSGRGLHERWRRTDTWSAPIKEHIAAAMVLMTSRGYSAPLIDPYCGSWTIPIEAAMIASNRAPWLDRSFACEDFPWFTFTDYIAETKKNAKTKIYKKKYRIFGFDNDPDMIAIAKKNAKNAWVDDIVSFEKHNSLHYQFKNDQTIITNPPYWNRIETQSVGRIHDTLFHKARYVKNMTIITWFEDTDDLYNPHFRETKPINNWADEVTLYFHKNTDTPTSSSRKSNYKK